MVRTDVYRSGYSQRLGLSALKRDVPPRSHIKSESYNKNSSIFDDLQKFQRDQISIPTNFTMF